MKEGESSWYLFLIGFLLVSCSSVPPGETERHPSGASAVPPGSDKEAAELVILNISGATLIPSNLNITDNGSLVVSLPRETYTRILISPGYHEFRFSEFPKGPRVAKLDALVGKTYYLVAGYSPVRSWAFPFAGDSMAINVVTEEEARKLMEDMKAQGD